LLPAVDDSTAFISFEMITACEADCLKDSSILRRCPNPLFLGFDAGRKKRPQRHRCRRENRRCVWIAFAIEMQNKTFSEQGASLSIAPLAGICAALASTLAWHAACRARREHFGWKIEPVTFTPRSRSSWPYQLRAPFENQKLRIACDDKLRHDLRGIRKEITKRQYPFPPGESDDSHCDRFGPKPFRQQAAQYRSIASRPQ